MSELNINIKTDVNNRMTTKNRNDYSGTPLHFAVQAYDLKKVNFLLKTCANPNIQDINGATPLHIAAEAYIPDAIKILLDNNADPNIPDNSGNTPFHIVCFRENCDSEIILAFIQKHAKINIRNSSGYTPLHRVIFCDNFKIMSILLDHGANPNFQDETSGRTSLHQAVWKTIEVVKILIAHHADVNLQNYFGQTPLFYAAGQGRLDIVKLLLDNGAKVNIQDNEGMTALFSAIERGHEDVVKIFIENNVEVNVQNHLGQTPLYFSARRGKAEVTQLLLDNGADINIQDKRRHTALYRYSTPSFRVMKKHVMKLKIAKAYLCEENLNLINDPDREDNPEWIEDFLNSCHDEVAKMKQEKIGNSSISFYQFLVASIYIKAYYLNDKNVVKNMKLVDWEKKFPLFGCILKNQFTEGLKCNERLKPVQFYGGFLIIIILIFSVRLTKFFYM